MRFDKTSDFVFLNDSTRFDFSKICQNFYFSLKLHSDLIFLRFYRFTIITLNYIEINVVASDNIRLLSSHMNEIINVINFDYKDIAFFLFCGHLLRIFSSNIHIRPSAALYGLAFSYIFL